MKVYIVNIQAKTLDVGLEKIPNGWNLEELGITEWIDEDDLLEQLRGDDLPENNSRLPYLEFGENFEIKII